jgi:hypothetical protein
LPYKQATGRCCFTGTASTYPAITGTITQGAAMLLGSNTLSDVLAELAGTFAG